LPSSLLQSFLTQNSPYTLPLISVKAGSIASDQNNPILTKFQGNALTISSTTRDCSILPGVSGPHSFMSINTIVPPASDGTLDNCDNLANGVNLFLKVDITGTSYTDATKLYLKLALPAPINATLISNAVVGSGSSRTFTIPVTRENKR